MISLLWAKTDPYKQLLCHMVDAGACAQALLTSRSSRALLDKLCGLWRCDRETATGFAAYLTAMHDIGKASPAFQRKDEARRAQLAAKCERNPFHNETGKARHEYYSAAAASRIWSAWDEDENVRNAYARILSLHHQQPPQGVRECSLKNQIWFRLQDELQQEMRQVFGIEPTLLKPVDLNACGMLLTGLLILSDWIASSGPFDGLPGYGPEYVEMSRRIAKETVREYGVASEELFPQIGDFQSMWPMITSPRPLQQVCSDLNPEAELTIIEAPMGQGKTEAALYLAGRQCSAWSKRGIYVALPTQATSNQMVGRVEKMLETIHGGNARLLHGMAYLMEDKAVRSEDVQEIHRWLRPLRMGLLGESAVGTVDQAMAAVLLARFSVLRLLGLANKVLVIDELHAYDAYMSEIIAMLLRWCRALDIPVILLSATLQQKQRERYLGCYVDELPSLSGAYPLITQVKDGQITERTADAALVSSYHYRPVAIGDDVDALAACALDQVKDGGCLCLMVNTVKAAQQVYSALWQKKPDDVLLMLFHARFTVERRAAIEQECLRIFGKDAGELRPRKAVLVATQVVEQSLDIDFDVMISQLAPIDLLLQRAGRVHRHRGRIRPDRHGEPIVHVIMPAADDPEELEKRYGRSGKVYAPFLLGNTEELLSKGLTIRVPEDVRDVIASVYDRVTPENEKSWMELSFSDEMMSSTALSVLWAKPNPDCFFPYEGESSFEELDVDDGYESSGHVSTRLGEPTIRVAFCSEEQFRAAHDQLPLQKTRQILMQSAALRSRGIEWDTLDPEQVYEPKQGPLRGCLISSSRDEICLGEKRWINDPILGIRQEE